MSSWDRKASTSSSSSSASSSKSCWNCFRQHITVNNNEEYSNAGEGSSGRNVHKDYHPLLWSRDLEKHFLGEFSFAIFQANDTIEDHSQVEVGKLATFVGVYDGHGGPEASKYISDQLFLHLIKLARANGRTMSEDVIRNAFSTTEEGFLTLVSRSFREKPIIAATGSCCLVGVIWQGTVYVANVGDSRAVVGFSRSNKIVAEQLTKEHNANIQEVRDELLSAHPNDSSILALKQGVWRVKGIIQVSRSIGDAYLKDPDLALDPTFPRFSFPQPITRPVLSAEPSIHTRVLQPNDRFLIFASDGLWEHLTNQEAVQIVFKGPRSGIARKLIKKAQKKVAERMKMKDEDLKKVAKGERRKYHDDITVVVIFFDHDLQNEGSSTITDEVSVKGFGQSNGPSKFNLLNNTA